MTNKITPPHDHDLERLLLGMALIYPNDAQHIAEKLTAADFHAIRNRQIFEAMAQINEAGDVIDILTTVDVLTEKHGKNNVESAYLIGLTNDVPFTASLNINAHIDRAIKISSQRYLIKLSSQLATDAINGHLNGNLADIKEKVGEVEARMIGPAIATTRAAASEFLASQKWRMENPGKLLGLSTGFDGLDRILDGLVDNKMYLIASREKMGKSSFGLSLMDEAIKQIDISAGQKVAIFSLEMNGDEIMGRLIARRLKTDIRKVTRGQMTPPQFERQAREIEKIESSMLIDTSPGVNPKYISAQLRNWTNQGHDIKMVVIDHFHIMNPNRVTGKDTQDTRAAANELLTVTKQEGIKAPFIVMAQCRKAVDDREDKKPRVGDILYSGALTQGAYAVMMLYRDEYYNPDDSFEPGIMDIFVRLNRGGPNGKITAQYVAEQTAVYPRVTKEINL